LAAGLPKHVVGAELQTPTQAEQVGWRHVPAPTAAQSASLVHPTWQ
jgi:hypothetical protein